MYLARKFGRMREQQLKANTKISVLDWIHSWKVALYLSPNVRAPARALSKSTHQQRTLSYTHFYRGMIDTLWNIKRNLIIIVYCMEVMSCAVCSMQMLARNRLSVMWQRCCLCKETISMVRFLSRVSFSFQRKKSPGQKILYHVDAKRYPLVSCESNWLCRFMYISIDEPLFPIRTHFPIYLLHTRYRGHKIILDYIQGVCSSPCE